MDLDEELFSFVFHHIFFPKKLPQEVEEHLDQLEHRMAEIIQAALQEFVRNLAPELQPKWKFAQNLVESWLQMHMDQGILQESLETGLSNLKSSGALACHIRAQNCALVVYYDGAKDSLLIDAFEVSCQDAQVLSSSGGLIRHFPGVSVAISGNKLSDRSFCSYLASSISQLASEEVSEMLPKTTRANATVDEHRATTHPGLITEGLMMQLLALGEENEDAGKILKCVRDEVNWHSALLPWRRSPAWLVLRVALQVVLRRCFPESEDRVQYKNFVLFLMARLSAGANIYHDSNNAVDCWAIIRQRLGRRLFKLKDDVLRFVAEEVESASNHLLEKLTSIQDQIRVSDRADTPLVPPSASPEDLHLSLLNSRPYLEAMMRLRPGEVQKKEFDRTDTMNLGWSNGLPVLQHDSVVAPTELEEWVEEHLQSWFKALSASELEKACVNLEDLMERYCSLAAPKYEDNPRAMSFMILVLLELWVVLDKIAIQICPILKNFSPEVPRKFLEPLLLPKMSQMTRATDVEQYIGTRHDERVENYPSIFSDPAPNCFGAHYFDSSDHHKDLETKIQMHAIYLRDRKRMEWEALHARYNELQSQLARMEHLWGNNRRGNYSHLSTNGRSQEKSLLENALFLSSTYPFGLLPGGIRPGN
ncbi:hypothetical protein N7535_007690 [Penicillium sp. DV-2018c]|nr:hypothetical protein N7535_007690 [Penicillium sp. DV-2018c]